MDGAELTVAARISGRASTRCARPWRSPGTAGANREPRLATGWRQRCRRAGRVPWSKPASLSSAPAANAVRILLDGWRSSCSPGTTTGTSATCGSFIARGPTAQCSSWATSTPPSRRAARDTFPFRIDGDVAYGPGVADAKGGLVVLVGAMRLLQDGEAALPTITVVLSPDEQAGSLRSRRVIERAASASSVCLCLECAREGGNLMGSRACCGVGRITVIGREAHAGTEQADGTERDLRLCTGWSTRWNS